jgi:hypothetical protein
MSLSVRPFLGAFRGQMAKTPGDGNRHWGSTSAKYRAAIASSTMKLGKVARGTCANPPRVFPVRLTA